MRFKVLDNNRVISTHSYGPNNVPVGSIIEERRELRESEISKFGPDILFNVYHLCASLEGEAVVFFIPDTDDDVEIIE